MKELTFAICCGTCVHVNRPKKPEDHAVHYDTAKTERWCFKNQIYTTREAVCCDHEFELKKGGVPAVKRAKNFNKRKERITATIERMHRLKMLCVTFSGYPERIEVRKDKYGVERLYMGGYSWAMSPKSNEDRYLDMLDEKLNEIEKGGVK